MGATSAQATTLPMSWMHVEGQDVLAFEFAQFNFGAVESETKDEAGTPLAMTQLHKLYRIGRRHSGHGR